MNINVRIISMHGDVNSSTGEREISGTTSVTDLLFELNLPPEDTYAVLLNDMPVSIEDRSSTLLSEGDNFTVFPPIKGG